ncbi:MAG: hemolysin III family protein [Actinomycetota bacterium]|nr:MAG: hemolysin III family protein [Actinomycetota bacterium]
MSSVNTAATKPKYRGVSHQAAFWISLALGVALMAGAKGDQARIAVGIYSVCLSAMFGVSAAFHRHTWSTVARLRMRRLDHSMIFAAVAGTYTPIALLALHGEVQAFILWLAWLGALAGIILQLAWIRAPKWLNAVVYVALGWAAILVLPELYHSSGIAALSLLLIGGALYTIGAIVYALRRPDPNPEIFGYHEVFHALVIAAALCHWVVIAFLI